MGSQHVMHVSLLVAAKAVPYVPAQQALQPVEPAGQRKSGLASKLRGLTKGLFGKIYENESRGWIWRLDLGEVDEWKIRKVKTPGWSA